MNQKTKTDDGALILQCNYMSDVLASLRQEELQIDVETYEGLYVSKSALHEDEITTIVTDDNGNEIEQSERVQGVYVINGNILEFKEVVIAYSGDDFIICKQTPSEEELFGDETIELYDRVVVGGTDLYDGKESMCDQNKLRDIEYNYKTIEENISAAAIKSGRSREDITFLAATKTVEPVYINHAISLGLKYIGENRVQELLSKYESYDLENASLHFIGHLQSNKVRQIINKVDLIQSVDSVKLSNEISRQSKLNNTDCDVLIEVNIGGEESKSGIQPEQLNELLYEISELDNVHVKGLMSIPPICDSKTEIRKYFLQMHKLFVDIKSKNR